ncbi:flagellin [Dyella subtropica]|uniref:flagellin N-terminal helical domain-containing protein n=1 Tax=Dyella subtropica TaxID=2992127 RepID=UPI002B1CC046|nr:flagellin [Dyella subtropica]
MSLVINTNVSSLTAQNNLTKSQSALAMATQRLSSGLKINSAKDNAAGYAISTRFTTQIGGIGQASSNASDAISLSQTTQSALDQVTSNLQAIRDLAVQSASGNYTTTDRQAIDTEVQQRLSEITRIANQTDFNGKKVLDGSTGTLTFQVGANVGQTISVSMNQGVKTSQLGAISEVSTGDIAAATFNTTTTPATAGSVVGSIAAPTDYSVTSAAFTVDGHAVNLNANYGTAAATVAAVQTQLNAAAPGTYSVSSAGGKLSIATTATGAGAAAPVLAGAGVATAFGGAPVSTAGAAAVTTPAPIASEGLTVNGTAIDTSKVKTVQDLSDAINASNISGVSAAVSSDGKGINIYSSDTTNGLKVGDTGAAVITGSSTGNGAAYTANTQLTAAGSLATGNVQTVDSSNDLISRVDVALSTVSNLNSTLGAVQNRFQSTISTLSSMSTNLTASQSTIRDADFATETANLSKANILQQAGISVLSQANSQPQQVLKLLQ